MKLKRKSKSASKLVSLLKNEVVFEAYPKGTRFVISNTEHKKIYLVKDGLLSLFRQPNDALLLIFEGPAIRGIAPYENSAIEYTLKVMRMSHVAVISYSFFCELLHKHNLWELYADHLHQSVTAAMEHIYNINKTHVYDIIRIQLIELLSEPDEARESITAEAYIKSKTGLSRSVILKVLSQLRIGGYITINRGILLSINKLPSKF